MVKVMTSAPAGSYEVLDCIFALDSHQEKFWSAAKPEQAFDGVKQQLIIKCKELGGNAVIGCQFEYRNAAEEGLFGAKQLIEIFAYGTVVKM